MDDNIIFRRACPQDQEQIFQLSEGIYSGADFFSYLFLDLLKSPIWYIYVAVDKEKSLIVACAAVLITDGGKTLVWRFGRVISTHRGKNLIKGVKSFALNDVKLLKFAIACERRMIIVDILTKDSTKFRNANLFSHSEMNCFVVDCEAAKRILVNNDVPGDGLLQLSLQEVQESRRCQVHLASLLPNGMIAIESDCFTLLDMSEDEKNFVEELQLGFLVSNVIRNHHSFNLQQTSPDVTSNENMVLSAIYWKPLKFSTDTWGIVMSIYGYHSDSILRHIAYVVRFLVENIENERMIQIKVVCSKGKEKSGTKICQLVKSWADELGENWIQCIYNTDIIFTDSFSV